MISSELEISYSSTGRLQVKMFGVSKNLCHRLTTEKGTGEMQINRNLPKEIKTALRKYKYEKVEIKINERNFLKRLPPISKLSLSSHFLILANGPFCCRYVTALLLASCFALVAV